MKLPTAYSQILSTANGRVTLDAGGQQDFVNQLGFSTCSGGGEHFNPIALIPVTNTTATVTSTFSNVPFAAIASLTIAPVSVFRSQGMSILADKHNRRNRLPPCQHQQKQVRLQAALRPPSSLAMGLHTLLLVTGPSYRPPTLSPCPSIMEPLSELPRIWEVDHPLLSCPQDTSIHQAAQEGNPFLSSVLRILTGSMLGWVSGELR